MDGEIAFDHGAQYVTMRTTSFKQVIHAAAEADAAKSWQPKFHSQSLVADQDWVFGALTDALADHGGG
jgi:predicted NAD/FAD-dependent oxidoreductase